MSLPVVLRPEAESEFDEAFDWYERQRRGLGVEFAARINDTLNHISEAPERYEAVLEDVRRAVVRRFPYLIFYRAETQQIVVLAIFHGKRDPLDWQSRI